MTRRTIATILSAILVTLTVALQSPAVRAYEPCDGQADNRCTATTAIVDDTVPLHVQAVAASAQATAPRAIERVADSVYYVPIADDMWAIFAYQMDDLVVIEDYVSGPAPTNSVAIHP